MLNPMKKTARPDGAGGLFQWAVQDDSPWADSGAAEGRSCAFRPALPAWRRSKKGA